MSYLDSIRLHFVGDREKAMRHVRFARRIAFNLLRQAREAGVEIVRREVTLEDGTVVRVVVAGLEVSATIFVPLADEERRKIDDFVVWARDLDQPDGIHEELPEQILTTSRTYFANGSLDAYNEFDGPKATYSQVFPDGIRHHGNVDWVSEDRLRINWYGPSSRYFYDAYVQPRAIYGKQVFLLGQVLLDTDQYELDLEASLFPERYVMGAGLRGTNELLVMLADLPVAVAEPPDTGSGTVVVPPPWPTGDVSLRLVRFRLARRTDPEQTEFMKVVVGEHLTLWSGVLPCGVHPWFFNQEGTEASSVGLPSDVFAGWSTSTSGVYKSPATDSVLYTLAIEEETAVLSSDGNSLGVAPATAVLAVDYVDNTRVFATVRREAAPSATALFHPLDLFYLEFGGAEFPFYTLQFNQSASHQTTSRNHFVYLDLRTNVLLTYVLDVDLLVDGAVNSRHFYVDQWRNGTRVFRQELDWTTAAAAGMPRAVAYWPRDWIDEHGSAPASPQFALYATYHAQEGVVTRLSWYNSAASTANLPWPAADYYSHYRNFTTYVQVADRSNAGFSSDKLDHDGKVSVLGCASNERTTMFSLPHPAPVADDSVHGITGEGSDRQLPARTGVDGDNSRYHPIWLLGQPPRGA